MSTLTILASSSCARMARSLMTALEHRSPRPIRPLAGPGTRRPTRTAKVPPAILRRAPRELQKAARGSAGNLPERAPPPLEPRPILPPAARQPDRGWGLASPGRGPRLPRVLSLSIPRACAAAARRAEGGQWSRCAAQARRWRGGRLGGHRSEPNTTVGTGSWQESAGPGGDHTNRSPAEGSSSVLRSAFAALSPSLSAGSR